MFFRAHREPGIAAFHQERRKFLATNLRKHGEQIGESGIGDPHLLAVQDVVLAIFRKFRPRPAVHRIRTRSRLRERICSHHFSGRQPGQILFLLLFRPEINDGQSPDSRMSAPGRREAGVLGDVIGDDRGGDFIHFQAAVRLRNLHARKPQLPSLLQQIARDLKFLVFDALDVGKNLVDRKLFGSLPDQRVLLAEIFGSKYFRRLPLFQKERTASDLGLWNCSSRHLDKPNPFQSKIWRSKSSKSSLHETFVRLVVAFTSTPSHSRSAGCHPSNAQH